MCQAVFLTCVGQLITEWQEKKTPTKRHHTFLLGRCELLCVYVCGCVHVQLTPFAITCCFSSHISARCLPSSTRTMRLASMSRLNLHSCPPLVFLTPHLPTGTHTFRVLCIGTVQLLSPFLRCSSCLRASVVSAYVDVGMHVCVVGGIFASRP